MKIEYCLQLSNLLCILFSVLFVIMLAITEWYACSAGNSKHASENRKDAILYGIFAFIQLLGVIVVSVLYTNDFRFLIIDLILLGCAIIGTGLYWIRHIV